MAVTPKNIANKDRLIFALDVADTDTARQLVEQLGGVEEAKAAIDFYADLTGQ